MWIQNSAHNYQRTRKSLKKQFWMQQKRTLRKGAKMLDALQAKEIAKTNFSALENDLELNNEYFKRISNIVADMQKDEPNAVFKMYSWEGDLITSILPIMLEANAFEEINWNWDKKLKEEKQILNKIGV